MQQKWEYITIQQSVIYLSSRQADAGEFGFVAQLPGVNKVTPYKWHGRETGGIEIHYGAGFFFGNLYEALGARGWEMCGATGAWLYFKRPIPETTTRTPASGS